MTYEFDPSDVNTVTGVLDRVAEPTAELLEIWERAWRDEDFNILDEKLRAEIDFIFSYELQEEFGSPGEVRLVQSGLSLTATRPMSETPSGAWILWTHVCDRVQTPVVRAHVSDVLLSARVRTKPEHAKSTIAAYLEIPDIAGVSAQQAALALARANSIARSRGMTEESAVRASMRVQSEIFGDAPETRGPALTLLAALSANPRGGVVEADERQAMRKRLRAIGEGTSFLTDEAAKTLLRLADNEEELESDRRWHVQQYLTLANSEDNGMQKMHHAQAAADLASNYGLQDLKDAAVLIMQSVSHDSMGWKSVSHEVKMSKNAFRSHLRRYRRARDWNHALMTFLAGPSPSGDYEANKRNAARSAEGSIRALLTRTVFGTHGLPERTDGDFLEEEVIRAETVSLNLSATLLALELEFICDRFSPPEADHIANWMVCNLSADAAHAHLFAKSLALHWGGSYSESARLSVPLIESAARGLLRTLDEPLYRTQRGDSPGRFPAMDFYVDALARRDLDPDWVRALRTTLLSPGMNFRNLSAHGFMMEFSVQQSALLLRLAGLFCAMPFNAHEDVLEALPTVMRRRLRRRLGWVWS